MRKLLLMLILVTTASGVGVAKANAQQESTLYTETVLYSFTGGQDGQPSTQLQGNDSLVIDSSGNLYGTTNGGGANSGGALFKLDSSGKYTVLHSFCFQDCPGGSAPTSLIRDVSGILYGTTLGGGADQFTPAGTLGAGTIFKLDSAGNYTLLYSFCAQANCTDGLHPYGRLAEDGSGNLYGTTQDGGANNGGTVFKLDPAGNYSILYSFCSQANCIDGASPNAGLFEDASGNFFGTAVNGGASGFGTAFKLDTAGHYTVLYNFCSQANCSDGEYPFAGLVGDASGNLYGNTFNGGNTNGGIVPGGGVAFKIDSSGKFIVLHTFCQQGNCTDGGNPASSFIKDSSGNFYGTTIDGYDGEVFKLDSAGNYTILHTFSYLIDPNYADGFDPVGSLVEDAFGTLYGMTVGGGTIATGRGEGVIYNLVTPSFSIGANATTITINSPGEQGTAAVTITPRDGFNQAITFSDSSCSGLPTGASCSFSPSSVTPSGGVAETTLTISTTATSSSIFQKPLERGKGVFLAFMLPGLLIVVPAASRGRWSVRRIGKIFVLLLVSSVIGLNGCGGGGAGSSIGGGGGSSSGGGSGATPAGTYKVTVTATGSGVSQAMALTLVVQ
jgi:uncharacterized repeat protein (TIGR03803 family)